MKNNQLSDRNYSASGCKGLDIDWTINTTAQFPVQPGTAVEITCSDPKAILKGSKRVTCVLKETSILTHI